MKNKKTNAAHIWKQFHDVLVPQLRLSPIDRAVYSHLLRHSHLEGTSRLSFSIAWLARGTRVCGETARRALRRLVSLGALRLIVRSKAGHVVDVRAPGQICARRAEAAHTRRPARASAANIERADFTKDKRLRELIHAREAGLCFYCRRRIQSAMRCLDHVVPRAKCGTNSYRNLVSACVECNSQKGRWPAAQLLRQLYRECRLSSTELAERLRALEALAAGKLRPALPDSDKPLRPRGRPRIHPEPRKGQPVRSHASRHAGPAHHWSRRRSSDDAAN